jgi:hypothetical protein
LRTTCLGCPRKVIQTWEILNKWCGIKIKKSHFTWVFHEGLFYFLFLFLVGLGFEYRSSHLQSRHFTAWVTHSVHFTLVIFEMGSLENYFLGLILNGDPLNLSFSSS